MKWKNKPKPTLKQYYYALARKYPERANEILDKLDRLNWIMNINKPIPENYSCRLSEASLGKYFKTSLGLGRKEVNQLIEFLKKHQGEDERIPNWISHLEVYRMRLLGSAANTVMGLAGLGVGAYNAFKGAGSASKGVLVSEVKSKLKKKYPFLDEASLNIISRRFIEVYTPNNQNPLANQNNSGSQTSPLTGNVSNNDLSGIALDISKKYNGSFSSEDIRAALNGTGNNPVLTALSQNALADRFNNQNSTK